MINKKQVIIWRLGLGCSVRNRAINENGLKFYIKTNKAIVTNYLCPPTPNPEYNQTKIYPGQGTSLVAQWLRTCLLGFPGGTLVENLPANAGDKGSSPGLGRSHVPRRN